MNVTPLKQPAPDRGRWYVVPPYRCPTSPAWERSWHVVDEHGELIATFELREDCEAAVEAYNARITK